jgi:hypothetical protein
MFELVREGTHKTKVISVFAPLLSGSHAIKKTCTGLKKMLPGWFNGETWTIDLNMTINAYLLL